MSDRYLFSLKKDPSVAARIVTGIIDDLQSRCGLDNEWDACDADIQIEIIEAWLELVRGVLFTGDDDA